MSQLLAFSSMGPTSPQVLGVSRVGSIFQTPANDWTSTSQLDSRKLAGVAGICASISAAVGAMTGRASAKRQAARRVELRAGFDPRREVGALEPMGYWDPLHLMKTGFKNPNGEWKSEETFRWYRAAELKHGRISMVAMFGLWNASAWKFGGFEDVPNGMAALDTSQGGAALGAIILASGMLELGSWKQDPTKEPGDFGWDPLGFLTMPSESGEGMFCEYDTDMRNKELNNGRLAMSAFATSVWFEYAGQAPGTQWSLTALPGWFVPALIGVLCFVNGSAFYVADDSAADQPKYLTDEYKEKKLLKA